MTAKGSTTSPGRGHHDVRTLATLADVRKHGRRAAPRDPATIDGIVVHQMAVVLSPPAYLLRRGMGPRDALVRRCLRVRAHMCALRSGLTVLTCPVTWPVMHAGRLNSRSLGLEVEGRYPGLVGGRVWGGTATEPTEVLIETARLALRRLVAAGDAAGCHLQFLWAHRQSSRWRRADPGQALWMALASTARALGLVTQPAVAVGGGRPIPVAWDADGVGRY